MKTIEQGFELRGQATPIRVLFGDVWRARSLIRVLSRREFYVRYRRPSLGVAWSLVTPLIQAIVLTIVFSRFVPVQTAIPRLIFMLSGILPWTFFSMTLGAATRAITGGSGMASKVYFPRAILPLVTTGSNAYAFVPTLVVLLGAAAAFGLGDPNFDPMTLELLWLVPGAVVMVMLTASFSLVVAALQVYFRDVAYAITALLQAWFYASAVFFPLTAAPEGIFRDAMIVNPATGMVELFRVAFQGLQPHSLTAVWFTLGWTGALLVAAAFIYRRFDRVFVDLL